MNQYYVTRFKQPDKLACLLVIRVRAERNVRDAALEGEALSCDRGDLFWFAHDHLG